MPEPGLTLAIECSTSKGSIALFEGDSLLAEESWAHQNTHGENVVSTIDICFKRSNRKLSDLKLIAVDIGPGRFTGVRVAVNAARTLAYSLDVKVAAFDSLRVLAENSPQKDIPVLCILNAHKNMVYMASYQFVSPGWVPDLTPQALKLGELHQLIRKPHLCLGDGFKAYESEFSPELKSLMIRNARVSDYPEAQALARLAERNANSCQTLVWRDVLPLYIRQSEAEEKLKTGSLKPVSHRDI